MDSKEETLIGAFCTLITPYRDYTEATVIDDYGSGGLLILLSNGKELTVYRSDLIVYND